MQTEEPIEHLVIINGLFIPNEGKSELIEINLCSYDINKKQVSSESSYFIKSTAISYLLTLSSSIINHELLAKAEDVLLIIAKIKGFFEENYIKHNLIFGFIYKDERIMTFFDNLLSYQRYKSFNLFAEFKSFYIENASSLDDMLIKLKLKQTDPNTYSLRELNTMVRVVNKMIKDGKQFSFSYIQIQPHETKKEKQIPIRTITLYQVPNYIKPFYLRFKGFPVTITKQELINLLYLNDISDNNIAISYDIFGRKTGEVVIRTYHEGNHREIMTHYKYYNYRDNIVDVIETNENDYNSCLKSEEFAKNASVNKKNGYKDINIFLKMSKIPYSAREEDIRNFLKNYTIAENGIKLNKYRKGNSTGEAVIAFINEKECLDVLQRENGRILMNQ